MVIEHDLRAKTPLAFVARENGFQLFRLMPWSEEKIVTGPSEQGPAMPTRALVAVVLVALRALEYPSLA
jgi:hypothetical protein